MTDTTERPEVDDPRVLALAKARQQLAYENPFNAVCPPWEGLTEQEQRLSLLDARSYLHAALRAGLVPAASAAVVPAADRAALRDRIAAAVQPLLMDTLPKPIAAVRADEVADVVLAVLPAPADRAAVLRETADRLVEEIQRGFLSHRDVRLAGLCESVGLLRQWAAEVAAVPVVGVAADTTPAEAHPPTATWKVESPRRDTWASWGATYDDRDWAQERYESATANAPARAFRLVRATTTYTVEAEHRPTQPGNDTKTPVGYRSRDGRALYCTRHTGEIFGFGWRPVDSDDLPDGGICTYPDCGADVVIPQQPKEA